MRYLVVCDRTVGSNVLSEHLAERQPGPPSLIHLIVPASHSNTGWTWSEGGDHVQAERQLRHGLEQLQSAGLEVTGEVGDPDPMEAIRDVMLRKSSFDEIVLVTPPLGLSRRFGPDLRHRVERSFSVPVSQIEASPTRSYAGQEIPQAGLYVVDRSNSSVEFVARFLMISKVRGRFGNFSGELRIAEVPADSSVTMTIDAASISTGDERRDAHLRTADFLDVDRYPTLDFASTSVSPQADRTWEVTGDLTLHGVTRPAALTVAFTGVAATEDGEQRAGFSASGDLDREDWGLTWNQALEAGGVLIGKTIHIQLEVQVVRAS